MLTLQQAYEVKESILSYLRTTFAFKEPEVRRAFMEKVTDEEEGLFKGPYISTRLPFESEAGTESIPLEIKPPFPPFSHQLQAFQQLSAREGHEPEPTILTTGTGSGKTEAFLYPILDYCYQHLDRSGIKCIILYPMNALATDQAGRLAEAIHRDLRLKGKITAGLFIGEGRDKTKYPAFMGEDHIIENRNTIIDAPPDILLTNFKMLDYGLMRSNFHHLWHYNLKDPSLLKFLVLDELHTYDGAQGTDVANLIRRLKLKLGLEVGQLCPVGTSATIGSGEEAKSLLAEYARKVFGESITEAAIIDEKRQAQEVFFGKTREALSQRIPTAYKLKDTLLSAGEEYQSYLDRQKDLWGINPAIDPVGLGRELKELTFIWDLIAICKEQMPSMRQLMRALDRINDEFARLPDWDAAAHFNPKEAVIQSALSLLSEARNEVQLTDKKIQLPLLYLQVQLWGRELRQLLRELSQTPVFSWRSYHNIPAVRQALPVWFCRDCGASGWLGLKLEAKDYFESAVGDIQARYYNNDKNVYFLNLDQPEHLAIDAYEFTDMLRGYLDIDSLMMHDEEGSDRIAVVAYRKIQNNRAIHECPECATRNSIVIIGSRVSTLSSITTSQLFSSDLLPAPEKERKLLGFTNSVQDAAHLAGYIQARNFRFTFRTALQTVINQFERPVSVVDLTEAFINYWKEKSDERGERPLSAYLNKFFPPDLLGKVSIEGKRIKDDHFQATFVREFDSRIAWEIQSEFGYNAQIGQTLEKTASSAVGFEAERVLQAIDKVKPWLEKNWNQSVDEKVFGAFLHGLLHRIRMRGGVDHPFLSKFRDTKLSLWDLNWMQDKRHYMNQNFHAQDRFPRIVTAERESRGLLDSSFSTGSENWFHAYYKKTFLLNSDHRDAINEFYDQLFSILADEEVEIFSEMEAKKIRNYALEPQSMVVSKHGLSLECDRCRHQLTVEEQEAGRVEAAACLQYRCTGHYQKQPVLKAGNYYQEVYNRQRSPRIYATEHTGLLERRDREKKEQDFRERPRYNSLNVLMATSTLEMGIDIGDLNMAMNTSVPPLVSNFLQRIGRAGRKSGAALILNFANTAPHDLYYFEEPKEMMQGEVHTPGCYLEAREILKRHFLAFCIDSWTSEAPEQNKIPARVMGLKMNSLQLNDPSLFFNRLIHFTKINEVPLLESFKKKYEGEVSEQVFEELERWMRTEGLYLALKKSFLNLKEEYDQLGDKILSINEYIKEKGLSKQEEEYQNLLTEVRNQKGLRRVLRKRQVLEYMTNSGLLPNYAFPETGVTLAARIMKTHNPGDVGKPVFEEKEVVRPANMAIRELTPGNVFYTQGYKLKVTGLTVLNWQEEARQFKFCSVCDHLEEVQKAIEGPCPKCGDLSWQAHSNQHTFLKLQLVKSFNFESDARVDDSAEERERGFMHRTHHLRFNSGKTLGAYAIKEKGFGFEFVRGIDVIDVNEGTSEDHNEYSQTLTIADRKVPRAGYITCKYCGHATSTRLKKDGRNSNQRKEARDYHYAYCKYRGHAYQDRMDEVFEEVYLYREMRTEALKILLPVASYEADDKVLLYKSGIELGLRKYYKGNPQHIRIETYREPNQQNNQSDQYLVLYDTVPGGTGYLEQLFKPEVFLKVLELAYSAIKECTCRHKEKDGCYHCIYSYGNQYSQEELSRERAEKLFQSLIERSEQLEFYENGLSNILKSGQIEESELEDRFIRLIRNLALKDERKQQGWSFEVSNQDGVVCYYLTMVANDKKLTYFIRPQYAMGPSQGVSFYTEADFLMTCIEAEIGGKKCKREELLRFLPVAVFLDGYLYHATKEHLRVEGDIQKRQAVVRSQRFLTWTLTWEDIDLYEDGKEDDLGGKLAKKSNNKRVIKQLAQRNGYYEEGMFELKNSVDRLLWLLLHADEPSSLRKQFEFYLGVFVNSSMRFDPSDAYKIFSGEITLAEANAYNQPDAFVMLELPDLEELELSAFVGMKDWVLLCSIGLCLTGENVDKASWQFFWWMFNLTQMGEEQIHIKFRDEAVPQHMPEEGGEDIEEVLRYYDMEYHSIVRQLMEKEIPFSKDGTFALINEVGRLEAEAVLGFEQKKIFLGPLDEEQARIFKDKGYTEISAEEFDITQLL